MSNLDSIYKQLQKGLNITSKGAGEDVNADVVKVEHRYTNFSIGVNATLQTIAGVNASVSRLLHLVNVGMISSPTLTIYDNPSGASGTILALLNANAPVNSYLYDVNAVTGLTAWITAGNATQINLSYR